MQPKIKIRFSVGKKSRRVEPESQVDQNPNANQILSRPSPTALTDSSRLEESGRVPITELTEYDSNSDLLPRCPSSDERLPQCVDSEQNFPIPFYQPIPFSLPICGTDADTQTQTQVCEDEDDPNSQKGPTVAFEPIPDSEKRASIDSGGPGGGQSKPLDSKQVLENAKRLSGQSNPRKRADGLSVTPDFVLVWKESSDDQNSTKAAKTRNIYEYNLEEEGLILESGQFKELHVIKVWAPLEVLLTYAEILHLKLPIKQISSLKSIKPMTVSQKSSRNSLRDVAPALCCACWKCWDKFKNISRLDPKLFPKLKRKYKEVYTKERESLFDITPDNIDENFSVMARARIVQHVMKRTAFKMGKALKQDVHAYGYEQLIKDKVYEDGYIVHDGTIKDNGSTRKLLNDHWGKICKFYKSQPLDTIRDYYGEEFALHYAWNGFYIRMLIYASIMGICCYLYGKITMRWDKYIYDICDPMLDFIMCPKCDEICPYWNITEYCGSAKFSYAFDNDSTCIFAFLMSIWAVMFLVFWKRYTSYLLHNWDLSNIEMRRDLTPRSGYVAALKEIYPHGKKKVQENEKKDSKKKSQNDKEKTDVEKQKEEDEFAELTIPFWGKKLPNLILSYSVTTIMVVIAFVVLLCVIVYRIWIRRKLAAKAAAKGEQSGGMDHTLIIGCTAGLMNFVFIFVFGMIYAKYAVKLTEKEYHRTQTEFDISLSVKKFMITALNSYCAISYAAFFKGGFTGAPHKYNRLFGMRAEECGISCMPDLSMYLLIMCASGQIMPIVMKILVPWIMRKIKRKKIDKELRKSLEEDSTEQWVKDFDLLGCGGTAYLNEEYMEMVIQFGFLVFFVSALPLLPLFLLIVNIIKLRAQAGKLLKHHRRPVGQQVKDIGIWYYYMDAIVQLAILSNAVIIGSSSNFIPKTMYRLKLVGELIPRDYFTLEGYLKFSLTGFRTSDLNPPVNADVITKSKLNTPVCYYATLRYGYGDPTSPPPQGHEYHFTSDHYEIWLARAAFVILYENVISILLQLIKWIVPATPAKLDLKIRREEDILSQLIEKTQVELAKSKKLNVKHSRVLIVEEEDEG